MSNVRFISVGDVVYLRSNDVIELLNTFASTEETDVRNRLNELISNLHKNCEEWQRYMGGPKNV